MTIIAKYLPIITLLVGAVVSWFATDAHWESKYLSQELKLQTARKDNAEKIIQINRLSNEKDRKVAALVAENEQLRNTEAKVIIKEVVKYVETNSNSKCELDDDWVRITDSATPMPRTSGAASGTDDGATSVQNLGEALEVITDNYQVCQIAVDRYRLWQTWYKSTLTDE